MLLIWVLAAAVLTGYLRGGRLKHYVQEPLGWLACPIVAFALESLIPLWQRLSLPETVWLGCMVLAQYALLLLFCYRNRSRGIQHVAHWSGFPEQPGCHVLQGFRMPVSSAVYDYPVFASFVARVSAGELPEYVIVNHTAPLWFLGDVIPVPYVLPGMASVGDVLLGVGIFLLMQQLMGLGKGKSSVATPTPVKK